MARKSFPQDLRNATLQYDVTAPPFRMDHDDVEQAVAEFFPAMPVWCPSFDSDSNKTEADADNYGAEPEAVQCRKSSTRFAHTGGVLAFTDAAGNERVCADTVPLEATLDQVPMQVGLSPCSNDGVVGDAATFGYAVPMVTDSRSVSSVQTDGAAHDVVGSVVMYTPDGSHRRADSDGISVEAVDNGATCGHGTLPTVCTARNGFGVQRVSEAHDIRGSMVDSGSWVPPEPDAPRKAVNDWTSVSVGPVQQKVSARRRRWLKNAVRAG